MTAELAAATWPALGTTATVVTVERGDLTAVREAVAAEVAAIDFACSRFREDSELSQLNAAAGRGPRHVSPLFVEALAAGLRAARLTDGDVDPTLGEALVLAGYDRDFAEIENAAPTATAPAPLRSAPLARPHLRLRRIGGPAAVTLDERAGTVALARGVQLDLGATAKALAADRAADAAARACSGGVLVGLGGDVAVAGPAPARGWPVAVSDDHAAPIGAADETIAIADGGVATSSVAVRAWMRGDRAMHHIIDPATGEPAEVVWRTASVAAGSCLDANIAATAAIVRGRRAVEWLESQGLPARLVAPDGAVTRLYGWPAPATAGTAPATAGTAPATATAAPATPSTVPR